MINSTAFYFQYPFLSQCLSENESHSVVSNSLWPCGLYSPWNSPGQNTGMGSLSLFQRIFPTQRSNPGLPHCTRILYQLSYTSVQFSRSVVSNSLQPHEVQHARPPCPLPTPRVYPNSCPLSRWCHLNISSSVIPFSSCLQSFPASRSFLRSEFFAAGGQSIGVSASTLVLSMNTQNWSPLGWTGWISL